MSKKVKSLDDVRLDLSTLYDEFRSGHVDRADADSMANISGKIIKIEQIKLAREIFLSALRPKIDSVAELQGSIQKIGLVK